MFAVENSAPMCLLRAYRCRDHAAQLAIEGRVQLGEVLTYRKIEDASRQDPSEGEVRLQVPAPVETLHVDPMSGRIVSTTVAPGLLNYSSSYMHPVYALCMSHSAVGLPYLRKKMGRHVVHIRDTAKLLEDVAAALQFTPILDRDVHFVDLCPIIYNKGEVGPAPEGRSIHMYYSQKPPVFSSEREHRLAIGLSGLAATAPPRIALTLSRASEYCELLDDNDA